MSYSDNLPGNMMYSLTTVAKSVLFVTLLAVIVHGETENPCSRNNGGCFYKCKATTKSPFFQCLCPSGYFLHKDLIHCVGDNGSLPEVMFTISHKPNSINRIPLWGKENKNSTYILSGKQTTRLIGRRIVLLEIDPITLQLFGLASHQWIYKYTSFDDIDNNTTFNRQYNFQSIALDWINREMYGKTNGSIHTMTLNGNSIRNIKIKKDKAYHTYRIYMGMCIDLFNGFIYTYRNAEVFRITTDGLEYNVIFKDYEFYPAWFNCDIDYPNGKIFWQLYRKIFVSNLDGTLRTEIKSIGFPVDINVHGGYFYWITSETSIGSTIWRMTTNGTEDKEIVIETQGYISRLKVRNLYLPNGTSEVTCPAYAKCLGKQNSWICLSVNMICDGSHDCYDGYDEVYCNWCDHGDCRYHQIEIHCRSRRVYHRTSQINIMIDWKSHPFSNILTLNGLLLHNCSFFGIFYTYVDGSYSESRYINVRTLWLGHTFRQFISSNICRNISSLQTFVISGSKALPTLAKDALKELTEVEKFELSASSLQNFQKDTFSYCEGLKLLNLSMNVLFIIPPGAFDKLRVLEIIDIRGNTMKVTSAIFKMNFQLKSIYSDSFSFCCIKPDSVTDENCRAIQFDTSSCDDLIESKVLRVSLWLIGLVAMFGNANVFIARFFMRNSTKQSYIILVNNLGFADLLMGLYMILIAIHDVMFRSSYVWKEYDWRNSILCKLCGVTVLSSSEASVLFISLITVDRYLAIANPLSGPRITVKIAYMVSAITWLTSVSISLVPFLLYENFYSNSGVCVALPFSNRLVEGFTYSLSLFLGVNFCVYLFICIGQLALFIKIKRGSTGLRSTVTDRNTSVARMLAFVVVTDCLCWLPIFAMAILSLFGVPIPRDVYAWAIVFILPVNSAINPFIYTYSGVCKARKRRK